MGGSNMVVAMTESEVAALIRGQQELGGKIDGLSIAVARLETTVQHQSEQRSEAVADHRECREEVTQRLNSHEGRLSTIETLHEQQKGGLGAANVFWKALVGLLGVVVAVMTILIGAGVM
jgi:chromosome segregation ATPase